MDIIKRPGLIAALALTLAAVFVAPAPAQQGEAALLARKVQELYQAGKFADALPLAQRALELAEKAPGPGRLDVALALNNLPRSTGGSAAMARSRRSSSGRWRSARRLSAQTMATSPRC